MGFFEALLEPETVDVNDNWTEAAEHFVEIRAVLNRLRNNFATDMVETDRTIVRRCDQDSRFDSDRTLESS